MKNSFKKTIASLVAVIALAVPMGAIGVSTASATTTSTLFEDFQASPGVSGSYAPLSNIKSKDSNSRVYLTLSSATYSVTVQTWGLHSVSWSSSGTANCTISENGVLHSSVEIDEGQAKYIRNNVKDSYSYVGLKMCSTNYYNYSYVTGRWAADSSFTN